MIHHGYDPNDGVEGWTDKVFAQSSSYSVVQPIGGGKQNRADFKTYPEALIIALYTPRALLYIITKEGRAVCIPRGDYPRLLALYNQLTGQRLKMPADPLEQKAERTYDTKDQSIPRIRAGHPSSPKGKRADRPPLPRVRSPASSRK